MSKAFGKRMIAMLLTTALLAGSPPEMYVYAAKPAETSEIQSETQKEELSENEGKEESTQNEETSKNQRETEKEEISENQNETKKEETSENQDKTETEETSENQKETEEEKDSVNQSEETEEISQEQSKTETQTQQQTNTENTDPMETEIESTSELETETETTSTLETETETESTLEIETETELTSASETETATEVFVLEEENADYPIDTEKYILTDVKMEPDKYSAAFSAKCTTEESYVSNSKFNVIYTTNAEELFKGKSSITFDELLNAQQNDIMSSVFNSADWKAEKIEGTSNEYSLQGIFKGNTYLEPNTTYYYRIAYSSGVDYKFLTALESFTTLAQPTDIQFTDFQTEIMDYNKVKVSWTVDNPESESIRSGPYLYYAKEGGEYSTKYSPYQYRDENNNVVSNKYYYEITPTQGKKLKVKLELEVTIIEDSSKPHPNSFKVDKEFDVTPYIPPETSSVSIKDVSVEDITYNKLKVVWTIDNPEKEYFTGNSTARPYLYYANVGEEYSQNSTYHTGSEYKDEQGNIVPNKYYYEVRTEGKPLKAKVGVKVFRGETDEEITSEEISITPYIPPETSAITMKDFQVEKIGYNKAKIVWTVENPEEEYITQKAEPYYMKDGVEQKIYNTNPYKDESEQPVPNKYYCEIETKGEALKVYLKWQVFRGEKNEYFKTEEIAINPYNIKNAVKVSLDCSTISSQATVTIDPWYEVDARNLSAYIYYREKNSTEWKSNYEYLDNAVETIQVDTLSPKTEYEYYIQLHVGYNNCMWNDGSAENPKTFTTKEITTYSDQDFPDTVFRSLVRKALALSDSDPITSDKLETLTSLSCNRNNSDITGDIKSIEGIQYIKNLTRISFDGHAITDASIIENLTKLTSISMRYNDLTELPDLSRINKLSSIYFDYNKIASDSFRTEKLPASFLEKNPKWLSNTVQKQRGEYQFITAPKYYAIGETHPFIIKAQALKSDQRKYTLTATIDGVDISLKSDFSGSEQLFYIEDISTVEGFSVTLDKEYTISSITLTDTYGNQYTSSNNYQFIFAEDEPYADKEYIDASQDYIYVSVKMPGTVEKNEIESIVMQDQSGNEIGRSNIEDLRIYSQNGYENRYENSLGSINISSLRRQITTISPNISFSKYLSAGEYNVIITMKDGKTHCLENVVEVIGKDIVSVSSLSLTSNSDGYDNYGDYLHVKLYGINLDPDKIWPVFYKEDAVITELVDAELYPNNNNPYILYTLKKLDRETYWQQTGTSPTWYDYRLEADKGYSFVDNISGSHSISLKNIDYNRNCILFEHYNYKKGVYEVTVDSAVSDGQKMFVSLYEDEAHTKLKATAEGIVESSQLLLKFQDTEGKDYAPPRNKDTYFIYEYRDNTNQKLGEFTNKKNVDWYCYYENEKNNISNYTILYQRSGLKELALKIRISSDEVADKTKTIEARIYAADGSEKGSRVTLTPETIGSSIQYSGNWQSAQGLDEGIYTIKYTQEGTVLYSALLYVYDNNKFYMNYQDLGKDAEGTYIRITSEQLYGEYIHEYQQSVSKEQALQIWNENYTLNIYDKFQNEITGWSVKSAKWYLNSFYVYLENLSEDYIGYYMRVEHKTKGLGEKLGTGKSYYSQTYQADETYGEWETISSPWGGWSTSSEKNAYIGFSAYIPEVFPVTVTITKPSSTDIVNRFTASLPEKNSNDSYTYYFTSGDIFGTEPDEVYRVELSGADGSSTDTTCYLGTNDKTTGDIIPATGVGLDKASANLSVGQSVTLKASIVPENATNQYLRWTSSRPSVAKVDKTTGKVTALQSGKTTITVYTHNSKKAECIVIVSESNYYISETEVTFDLSEGAEQSKILTVYEGNTSISGVTWSTDNEKVATVTKKEDGSGTVTPVGVGTAQIKAVLLDKTELICLVTVTASVTGISLDKNVLNLMPNQSEKLTATMIPENAVNQKLTWKSNNPEVASVDETGKVTALTLGTTVITVMTSNGHTAACTVTVSNYVISQSELTFQLGKDNPKTAILSVKSGDALVKDVTWSSDKESVATVAKKEDGSAEVTAVSAGTAKITAKMPDKTVLYCAITVLEDPAIPEYPATDILLDKTSLLLFEGQSEQLTAKVLPENATDKIVTWSSSDATIASVDNTGRVTAVSIGEAVITATTSNRLTASCTVRVDLEKPEFVVLTNIQKTLADIELPEGWSWTYPDIALDQFAGIQKKSFAAMYQPDKTKAPYYTSLKVQMIKVNRIAIAVQNQGNGTEKGFSIHKDKQASLYVHFYDTNNEVIDSSLVSACWNDIQWSSTKEDIASVRKDTSGVILTANKEGKTNIKAEILFGGKSYKAQYVVTVVDGEIAEISVLSIENFTQSANETEKNIFYYRANETLENALNATMQVAVTNADKLTVKSSNPKVVTVGKVTVIENSYQIPLTGKATGTAKITLTANDKAKTSKEIWLRISDPTPNLSESTITVNTMQTTGTTVWIYTNQDYTVKDAALTGTTQFTLEKDSTESNQYFVKAIDGVGKGNYKAEITATVNDKTYTMPLTIKVMEQKPAFKVKQKAKVNLFYTNVMTSLDITSEEVIENLGLTGCDFTVEQFDGKYYIAAKEGALAANKKGTMQVTLAGYKPFSVSYTVGVENKAFKPSLSAKTMTLYPNAGIDNARITVQNNKTPFDLEFVDVSLESTERCSLVKEGNEILLSAKDLSKAAAFKEKIILKSEYWNSDIVLPCTVKVNMGIPSVKLEQAALQLNRNKEIYDVKEGYAHDAAATTVMWKDAFSFSPQEITVTAVNAKAQALIDNNTVCFTTTQNQVIAQLRSTEAANGSYRFTVNVKISEDCTVTAPLTVKIVDVTAQKAVKVSLKGSIDLMNRKGSFVTATPSFKSMNGTIMDIRLTGRAAHLFCAVYDKDKVYIYAKDEEALITKYNYSVALKITLQNAEGKVIQITSPVIKLKLKQSKAKIMAAPKSAVFFSGADNSVKVNLKASLNGLPNPTITNVELINNTNVFSCRFSEGKLTLQTTGEAVKGKAYTLQFRVTLKGQADNEKAMVVKYQVKVQ